MTSEFLLTPEQVAEYHQRGLLGPFKLCEPEQMARLKEVVVRDIISAPSISPRLGGLAIASRHDRHRHLDERLMYDLCTLPAIIGPLTQLLGPQLMIYKTQFFDKPPFGRSIPWHQERPNWAMEAAELVSVWLAFDDAPVETGCMRVIPGTHRRIYEQVALAPGQTDVWPTFSKSIPVESWDPDSWDPESIVECHMRAGEFLLFSDLVHGSAANTTPNQRLAFTARYTPSQVPLAHYTFYPGHAAVAVGDVETNPSNRMLDPPVYRKGPRLADLLGKEAGGDRRQPTRLGD